MSRPAKLLSLAALMVVLFALSLMAGKVWVPFDAWFGTDPRWWIILELRLPRAILGAAIGGMLGLSGAVLQGYMRNPLADPGVLGISSGAAFGAVAAIFFGVGGSLLLLFGSAMAGAAGAILLLGIFVGRSASAVSLILAGTILASLGGALTAFLISISPNPFATSEIVTWIMGALTDRGYREAAYALPCIAIGMALLLTTGRALDALALGEESARSLGVPMGGLQALIVGAVGLGVGAGVAVTGVGGFVGLIVPHLLRPWFGERPSALLLPSLLGGAALLLAADILVRLAPGANEVKLGVAMAMIGAPFFFWLLLKYRGRILWN